MVVEIFDCPYCGNVISKNALANTKIREVKCTQCGSQTVCKDGKRKTPSGPIQRYLCQNCGIRFSAK